MASFAAPQSVDAADLDVTVTGLRSNDGDVHLAIYDNPARFPDSDGMLDEVTVKIAELTARHRFVDLEPGTYAIAVYHDENGNHDFDQGFLGIPLEDYGFSNGAKAFLGPPAFEDAAIRLDGDRSITIPIDE